jgi:hypothetical protein
MRTRSKTFGRKSVKLAKSQPALISYPKLPDFPHGLHDLCTVFCLRRVRFRHDEWC